jgi:hypothetical protein
MPLSEADRARLDDLQFMYGADAGRLALALDRLTDVMAQLGVHATYCRVEKGPRAGQPPLDLAELLDTIQQAKDLVQQTLLQLRNKPA